MVLRPHPFYALSPILRAPVTLALAVLAVAPLALLWVWPWSWLLTPLMASWGFFATTPFLRAVGFYRYYSPYLCAMVPTPQRLDIHLGTTFDHVFTMRASERGGVARARLLVGALDGLIEIATQVEQGTVDRSATIEGTSWFFSESTIRRLGFEPAAPTWLGRLIPFLIALDITMMTSFTRGALVWPRISRVSRAVTTGARLLEHRDRLRALRSRLVRRLGV